MMKRCALLVVLLVSFGIPTNGITAVTLVNQSLSVNGFTVQLKVPKGLRVDFVLPLSSPRFLTHGAGLELLVGSREAAIYRINWPYLSSETLPVPVNGRYHSAVYRNGSIYLAETAGLYSAPYTGATSTPQTGHYHLITPLPSQTGGHWSRTVIVGPDNRLYIGLGISHNCSDEFLGNSYPFEQRRGGVYVLDESGETPLLKPYSSGLRNPIGLVFHPVTHAFYATNAGPDNLGFYLPPEVFTTLSPGSFHGMPWFQYYNGAFHSGECATSPSPRAISDATVPAATFAARSTPEGVTFITSSVLGPTIKNNALVAIHGSWAVPAGGDDSTRRPPKIVMVDFSSGKPGNVIDIVTGFQRADGTRFARPCGMIMGPEGSLYFTSDSGEVTGLFRLTSASMPTIPNRSAPATNYILLKK